MAIGLRKIAPAKQAIGTHAQAEADDLFEMANLFPLVALRLGGDTTSAPRDGFVTHWRFRKAGPLVNPWAEVRAAASARPLDANMLSSSPRAESFVMSDDGPADLTLRHLRALDERMERMEAAIERLTQVLVGRFTGLEGRMLGIETRLSALEDWSAEVSRRLGRIERRLDLTDAPA
jgi:hypothetical protein